MYAKSTMNGGVQTCVVLDAEVVRNVVHFVFEVLMQVWFEVQVIMEFGWDGDTSRVGS